MRKSIFKTLEENFDIDTEMKRIYRVFNSKPVIDYNNYNYYSFEGIVDKYMFHNWKQRNTCINTSDMKNALKIDIIMEKDNTTFNEKLICLEYIKNILYLTFKCSRKKTINPEQSYDILYKNINTILDHINHEAKHFDDEEMVLIVEKNTTATAAADIVKPDLGMKIIKYNHYLLKGDIATKKDIILSLANELEPKRTELETIDIKLSKNLFFLLNNMNIRHNNKDESSTHYKEFIAKIGTEYLEEWYDETYQLELLAFLLMDNVKRNKKIDKLKKEMGLTS